MIRHVDSDLHALKDLLLTMGGAVEKALEDLDKGISSRNEATLLAVNDSEKLVNELHLEIDEACLRLLAKQAPLAKDLRFVISVIKINADLERMGDQTVNILRGASRFIHSQRKPIPPQWQDMMKDVRWMVKQSLDAFVSMNLKQSQAVIDHDDIVDDQMTDLIGVFKERMKSHPHDVDASIEAISMVKSLERVADHATNISEEVIFIVTGDDIRHGRLQSV